MLTAFAQPAFMSRLLGREQVLRARPKVTRLLAFGVAGGATRPLPRATGRMVVHCRSGVAWLVHEGELRDVVLQANQSYVVNSGQPMTAHALNGDCGLELQVDL